MLTDLLTSSQQTEWEAYNELEPVGDYRNDYMIAQLTSTLVSIAQSVYGAKGSRKEIHPSELIPWSDYQREPPKTQTIEDVKDIFRGIAAYLKENETGLAPQQDQNKDG